jgi:hypothetical protein
MGLHVTILSCQLLIRFPSGTFPSDFSKKALYIFLAIFLVSPCESRDSSVGIVTRLRAEQQMNLRWFPGRDKRFSRLRNVQIDSGAHPASSAVGIGESFSGQSGQAWS